jgi:FKBP-type peptidyl-prolyl cis-trans isomerase 2/DNA-binding NarL/FixJ family response regulator
MRTVQQGDRVYVHYVKRWQDGSVAGSREPLELTVGTDHPRLPGLGAELVGLAPGQATTLTVPPERAHGLPDPARVRRWSRERFPKEAKLRPGKLVRVTNAQGRHRLVRVLEVTGKVVVVDANHRRAGQRLDLEVQFVAFCEPGAGAGAPARRPGRAVAFDVDAASLASLREALPGWEVVATHGTSAASLARDGAPGGAADLLVVGARDNATEVLGLCRLLAARTPPLAGTREAAGEAPRGPRGGAPLLVLVPPEQQTLVGAALEAGARSCLLLPIHPKEVASVLAHARAGSRPGRHTLGLDRAEETDPWQEEGGEA